MLMQPFTPDLPLELDPAQPWPAQGEWTYDDYLRLPDDGLRVVAVRTLCGGPATAHCGVIGSRRAHG